MMNEKIELKVLGFSFNQNKTGAYGLVMAEVDGQRRLVVVVGTAEAQSIAFKLQNTTPPRPLTHDLIYALLSIFDIILHEVTIYAYIDGVFHAKLVLQQEDKLLELESRASDAINIAMRTGAPIYTTSDIMNDLAIVFDADNTINTDEMNHDKLSLNTDYSQLESDEIQKMLEQALVQENYELASLLRDELKKR